MTWAGIPRGGLATLLEKLVIYHTKVAELTIKKQLAQARLHLAIQGKEDPWAPTPAAPQSSPPAPDGPR
jgi:hypothetical protein